MSDSQNDGAGVSSVFIRSLWSMLGDSANADIIAWLPDGASFRIIDVAKLEARVLLHHFAHSNVASFVRQLSAYGFVSARVKRRDRVADSADSACTFRHDGGLFCRNHPLLSVRIVRQHAKRPGRQNSATKRRRPAPADTSSSSDTTAPISLADEQRLLSMQLEAQRIRIAQLVTHIAQLTEQLSTLPAVAIEQDNAGK